MAELDPKAVDVFLSENLGDDWNEIVMQMKRDFLDQLLNLSCIKKVNPHTDRNARRSL